MRNLITHVSYWKETDFLLHICACLLHVQDAQVQLKNYQKVEFMQLCLLLISREMSSYFGLNVFCRFEAVVLGI